MNALRMNTSPPGIDWSFLKRTALATVVTALLVGLISATYYMPAWGGRYLLTALWALAFFSLSGLIFKYMLFERRKVLGFVFIALKLVTLAALFLFALAWPLPEGEGHRPQALAMLAGVLTPMLVFALRFGGLLMTWGGGRKPAKARDHAAETNSVDSALSSSPTQGRLKSHT